jgi:hypothetical protein
VRPFLRSMPGWIAFQLLEYAILFGLARVLLALGLGAERTFLVAMALAVCLVVVNYNVRRRYLSDEDG